MSATAAKTSALRAWHSAATSSRPTDTPRQRRREAARKPPPVARWVACARQTVRTVAESVELSQEEAVMTMASQTPTIVLVHGAWADATGFDAEIRALRDRGLTA